MLVPTVFTECVVKLTLFGYWMLFSSIVLPELRGPTHKQLDIAKANETDLMYCNLFNVCAVKENSQKFIYYCWSVGSMECCQAANFWAGNWINRFFSSFYQIISPSDWMKMKTWNLYLEIHPLSLLLISLVSPPPDIRHRSTFCMRIPLFAPTSVEFFEK